MSDAVSAKTVFFALIRAALTGEIMTRTLRFMPTILPDSAELCKSSMRNCAFVLPRIVVESLL